MDSLFNDIEKGAEISECGKYRYRLWRIWDKSKAMVMFLMLNPSTADAMLDDPTVRRCIGFAKSWGYGGIVVCNLFAYRATNPKELLKVCDPMGQYNIYHIQKAIDESDLVIYAWGNGGIVRELFCRHRSFEKLKFGYCFDNHKGYYLKLSKDGTPCHPLYLKSDLSPINYLTKKVWQK